MQQLVDQRSPSSRGSGNAACNLIVNYLPASVSEDALRGLFAPYGEITSCKLMKDKQTGTPPPLLGMNLMIIKLMMQKNGATRYAASGQSLGYGFIEYQDPQSARQSIDGLNGTHSPPRSFILCSAMSIQPIYHLLLLSLSSLSTPSYAWGPLIRFRSVQPLLCLYHRRMCHHSFIIDLPCFALHTPLCTYPSIIIGRYSSSPAPFTLTTHRCAPCCVFLDCVSSSSCHDQQRTLHRTQGKPLENKRLKVSYARPSSSDIQHANLYVSKLDLSITKEKMDELFAPYGTIIDSKILIGIIIIVIVITLCFIARLQWPLHSPGERRMCADQATGGSRGVGFVRYDTRAQAEAAIAALNGVQPEGMQQPLGVKFADTVEDKAMKKRQQLGYGAPPAKGPAGGPAYGGGYGGGYGGYTGYGGARYSPYGAPSGKTRTQSLVI
jgi:RNA recognition motif-containing protein